LNAIEFEGFKKLFLCARLNLFSLKKGLFCEKGRLLGAQIEGNVYFCSEKKENL